MRSRFVHALLAFLVLPILACQTAPPAPATLSEADKQAIRDVTAKFMEYTLANDHEGLSQLYTEDAVVMAPNMPEIVGRAAIRDLWASFPQVAGGSAEDLSIEGAGDMAVVRGRYTMSFAVEGFPPDTGKYLDVRKRQPDGSWKIAVDIFNSDVAADLFAETQ